MELTGAWFPEAHLDAEKMAALAAAGCTELQFDVVAPLFSVCHEAAAMGCNVDWGGPLAMPNSGPPIFRDEGDIRIPADLLKRPGCATPLAAIALLRKRFGDDAAVCGKVFGGWTQGYHYFGVENFLIGTLDDPDKTRRILDRLTAITLQFARARSRPAPTASSWPITPRAICAARGPIGNSSCRCTGVWRRRFPSPWFFTLAATRPIAWGWWRRRG